MKKLLILFSICSLLLCSGCVSSSDYEQVNNNLQNAEQEIENYKSQIEDRDSQIEKITQEKADLQKNFDDLSQELKTANEKNSKLEEKIDELENGASNLLYEIRTAFEKEDYSKTVRLASDLHTKYNGSPEDVEAQKLSADAQTKLDEIEAEKQHQAELAAAEAAKTAEEKVHKLLRVYEMRVDRINSAGGVDVEISWINTSDKEIKYLYFEVVPYNAVGDRVSSEIGSKTTARLKITGPYAPGKGDAQIIGNKWYGSFWDAVWYNNTVKTIEFTKIEIEYMDGTSAIIKDDDLQYVIY